MKFSQLSLFCCGKLGGQGLNVLGLDSELLRVCGRSGMINFIKGGLGISTSVDFNSGVFER